MNVLSAYPDHLGEAAARHAALRRRPPHHPLADLRVPAMACKPPTATRRPMSNGQTTPYLDMLRAAIPTARIEIIEDTGHFPQIDESVQANVDRFLVSLHAS